MHTLELTITAIIVCALLLAGSHCGSTTRPAATVSPVELKTAPERVTIADRDYTISADLWRDFMPIAPPDGQPLRGIIRIQAADGKPAPADLEVTRIWVLSGKEQWSPKVPDAMVDRPGLELNVADGPKWAAGGLADIIVQLERGKQSWRLRAAGLPIKRTD